MHTLMFVGIGLLTGTLSGLLGIGGGVIIVPGLLLLTHCTIQQAIGTSLAIIIPTALIGAMTHHYLGNVLWGSLLLIVLGAAIGSFLGSHLSEVLPQEILKKGFGLFLLFVAWKMFFN